MACRRLGLENAAAADQLQNKAELSARPWRFAWRILLRKQLFSIGHQNYDDLLFSDGQLDMQ